MPPETVPVTEFTIPAETVPETEPTVPVETTPETAPTIPAETITETAPTIPTETVPETEPTIPTETVPETEPTPAETEPEVQWLTVEEVRGLPSGTEDITLCAVVVSLSGCDGVLQDSTGGIRVSFPEPPQTMPGDVILATGRRSGGLQIESFEIVDVAQLPAVETTLLDAPENLRIFVENALLGNQTLTQDGFTMSMQGLPAQGLAAGDRVDAWGVILDGWFLADTIVPTTAEALTPASASGEALTPYFGLLHAHSALHIGPAEIENLFRSAAEAENMDFFAITDNSDTFDPEGLGFITDGAKENPIWQAGQAAAAAVTDDSFLGLYGYEMSWPELGHISTLNTQGWQTRDQSDMKTLKGYYERLLLAENSISIFNHPGYGLGSFEGFADWRADYDARIQLLEVGSEKMEKYDHYYRMALNAGWHVAPVEGGSYYAYNAGEMGEARTVILAQSLQKEHIFEAIANHRVYATQDQDLRISYTLNTAPMGSILSQPRDLHIRAQVEDPTGGLIHKIEVMTNQKEPFAVQTGTGSTLDLDLRVPYDRQHTYFYLRVYRGEQIIAVTAPVWVDSYEDVSIRNFASDKDKPIRGEAVALSLDIFNEERQAFVPQILEMFVNDQPYAVEGVALETAEALGSVPVKIPLLWNKAGQTRIVVKITGILAEQIREISGSLTLLYQSEQLPEEADIADVRRATPGLPYQIEGRITSGNSNPYTTFPGMLYVQDETGGIAVKAHIEEELELGRRLKLTGLLVEEDGNLVLEMTDYTLLPPDTGNPEFTILSCAQAGNYSLYGGRLVQVRGTVISLTADGDKVSRITLRDDQGGQVTVLIEEKILSATHGVNKLASKVKKGRTIQAAGLVHIDEYGKCVLRVRNCDEVRYIAPVLDHSNPRTGDWLAELEAFFRRLFG